MEEGDCLFIPYHWFHQVNSFADDVTGQNLAINIWFKHVFNHRPVKCDILPNEATLDKFQFSEDKSEEENADDGEEEDEDRIPLYVFHFFSKFLWVNLLIAVDNGLSITNIRGILIRGLNSNSACGFNSI